MARDRSAAAAAATAAALLLMVLVAPAPAAADPDPFVPHVYVSPRTTGVPATVVASGSCPATDSTTDSETGTITYSYPFEGAKLAFPEAGVESTDVTLNDGNEDGETGEFSDESFELPATLVPDTYTVTLTCPTSDYSETDTATADVIVPPPPPAVEPTLTLDPPSAGVGDEVAANGTCPSSTQEVAVLVAGAERGRGPVGSDGKFGPIPFTVPDLSPGTHRVSTSCDATADLTVVVPPPTTSTSTSTSTETSTSTAAPTTSATPSSSSSSSSPAASSSAPSSSSTPTDSRVAVPDLTGLTEAQARDRLREAGLVLADRSGAGRVSRQNPPAGTLTEPASPVGIVLAADSRPTTGLSPVLIVVVALLVVAAAVAATLLWRGRQPRGPRWLDQHVSARLVEPRPAREFSAVPVGDTPGVSVRIQLRSTSGAQQTQEVHRARAGAHATGRANVPDLADDTARG